MKKILVFILGLTAVCLGPQMLSAKQRKAEAKPQIEVVESRYLHCNDTLAVYSPSGRCGEKDLPTLILMHGYGGRWSDWGMHAQLQEVCDISGFRIVCPDGFKDSWYLNDADASKMQWRSFFWEECWPMLAERYGLQADRTFICGLSMGGHGAMNIFLDHPELFRGAGSMSGVLDVRYSSGSKERIAQILGRKNIEKCDDQSAVYRLENLAKLGPSQVQNKLVIIGCGTEDYTFYPASRIFEARCCEMKVRHIGYYAPGKHSWDFWVDSLPYYLQWWNALLKE